MSDSAVERLERSLFMRTLFGSQSGPSVEQVVALMSDVYFDAGQTVYRKGEASREIYFIVKGQVVLEAEGLAPWTFGARDGIGFQDAMQDSAHTRTARALSAVHALAFSVEDWFDVLEGNPELGRGAVMGHARAVSRMIDELGFDAAFAPPGPGEPADLGRPPGLVDRMLMLTDAPLLARAGIQAVAVLARLGRPRLIRQGGLLHKQGEARTSLCLVGQGELQLAREGEPAVGRFGPGSVAGSLGMLARPRHDATLSAATDAVVLELDDDDFFEAMDDHFDLARAVFAYMAKERGRLMELIARRRALSS
ncbi:MAG: cyclic nucleotide-binding domain-containing protein [Polyangiaceae bacterium]|nr:cyclic nucleotide-binding domain-containing protein [Polyangiaceae bacterium]MCL4751237.1 cyclic nucleotide-binding domain-containing protein [Myxococcales bacterium]